MALLPLICLNACTDDGGGTNPTTVNDSGYDGGSVETTLVTVTTPPAATLPVTPYPMEVPIATTSGNELSISAAYDGTNILVGIRGDQDSPANITAQLVSSMTGSLVGPRVSVGRTGGAPSVAFDGSNYLMVWPDDATFPNKLYGQRISTSGQLVGAPFPIAVTGDEGGPVIFDSENYFVAWEIRSSPSVTDTADIYGQFISPSGALMGSIISVSTATHGQRMPALAFDGTNILVVWVDGRNQSACYTDPATQQNTCKESDVYGQFITKSSPGEAGALNGDNFLINESSLPNENPAISFNDTNYLVVMNEESTLPNACPSEGCQWRIYGRIVTTAGIPGDSRVILSDTTAARRSPKTGRCGSYHLVTWTENFGRPTSRIKGCYYDASGTSYGEFTIASPTEDGRLPWSATPASLKMIVNIGKPGADPLNTDSYTEQDVLGKMLPVISEIAVSPLATVQEPDTGANSSY